MTRYVSRESRINTKIFLRLSKWYYGVSCFFDLISK